jgi:succinylarginine dihydrolase
MTSSERFNENRGRTTHDAIIHVDKVPSATVIFGRRQTDGIFQNDVVALSLFQDFIHFFWHPAPVDLIQLKTARDVSNSLYKVKPVK